MLKVKEYKVSDLSPTTIVLISGKAGVGKSLASQIFLELVNTLDYLDSTVMHFAEDIKSIAKDRFGWNGEKDSKGRALLQGIGQTGRAYNPYMWAEKVLTKINSNPGIYDFVFIDDWRFPNEYEYLKNNSDYMIVSLCIEAEKREILKNTSAYNEISETALDTVRGYDFLIINGGTKAELQKYLAEALVYIIKKQEAQLNDRSS